MRGRIDQNQNEGGYGRYIKYLVAIMAVLAVIALFIYPGYFIPHGDDKGTDDSSADSYSKEEVEAMIAEAVTNASSDNDSADSYSKEEVEAMIAEAIANKAGNSTAGDDNPGDDVSSEDARVYSAEEMKDWISPSLKLQTTSVDNFESFATVAEAQEYFDGSYTWDEDHTKKWNLDEAGRKIAKNHKSDDPSKTIFFGKSAIYAVIPNGIVPKYYEVDEDGEFVAATPSNVQVIATDRLKKSSKD